VIDAERMLRGHPEIQLVYRGQVYRLRATKQGKLILTK
jgi:hemin uptake protein HemP